MTPVGAFQRGSGLPPLGSELFAFIPGGRRMAFGLHYLGCPLQYFSLYTEGLCTSLAPRRRLPHAESPEEASSCLLGVRTTGPLRRCRLTPLPPGFSFVGERFWHSLVIWPEKKIFLGNIYHKPLSPPAELVRFPFVQ